MAARPPRPPRSALYPQTRSKRRLLRCRATVDGELGFVGGAALDAAVDVLRLAPGDVGFVRIVRTVD